MVIAVLNLKGGTGKTTTALNLGVAVSKGTDKNKVLLVDLDPQGSLSFSLGCGKSDVSSSQLITEDVDLSEIILHLEEESVDLIPGDVSLADTEINLVSRENRQEILREKLKPLNRTYDYIILDCPPSLSLLTINAMVAADAVIIPFQLEVLSIRGLDQIIETTEKIRKSYNSDLQIAGLLPVMIDRRKKLTSEVFDYVREHFDAPIFSTSIRTNVRLSEAPSFAQSIFSYAPKSNGAKDYTALADEIISLNH